MHLRHAVHRGRRDVDDTAHAARSRAAASSAAVPSTLTDMISRREPRIGSAAAACTSTSAPSQSSRARAGSRMSPRISVDVALDRIVDRHDVERPHLVARATKRRARCRPRKPAPPEIAYVAMERP